MCGGATERKLLGLGISTIGDLAASHIELIKYKLKPAWGTMLWNYSHGIENSQVKPGVGSTPKIKGIGNSSTIKFDVTDKEDAYKILLSLTEMVAMRLRNQELCCRLVSVWIRTSELIGYSHQKKMQVPTDCTADIYKNACRLFDESWKGEAIRALGVRVSELCCNDFIQLSLLEDSWEKKRKIDKAVDRIRQEYGSHSVFRSCFLWTGLSPVLGGIIEEENNFIMSSML
jgi:DNA polymerase-4